MRQKLNRIIEFLTHNKLAFFILGIGSTIWFLIRVIPKPSRASYPCVQASAPFMSAFVIYLVGLASTIYVFREKKGRLLLKSTLALVFVVSLLISFSASENEASFAVVDVATLAPNEPIGIAQGTFPGRVVWVHNPEVTNANMANTMSDYWALDKNCSQALVDSMLTSGIRRLGGKANVKEAWEVIFKHFNTKQGKGNVGYTPGEKIAIKINLTNSNGDPGPNRMDASPQLVLSILHHLIEVVGVPQADIWMGDHYRRFRDNYYDKCHSIYPDVHYVDGTGGNGREKTVPSTQQLIQFSDKEETSSIPQHCVDAQYFINIPCLKSHDTAGITIAAKNHQGTILKEGDLPQNQYAMYMHYTFPKNNPHTDQYRHMVDYMGHEELGGKTLLYLVDALWAGRSWEGYLEKWTMAPFNNDYPSSLFLSQDAVAIESVCFDFLLTEYADKPTAQKYPYMVGLDDYMKQAADPEEWPEGIIYDPEGDGTPIASLGVYEHWNNATDMQYSRNLGTGNGIELVRYFALATDNYQGESTTDVAQSMTLDYKLYPNPFTENIRIEVRHSQPMSLEIYNMAGQLVFSQTLRNSYTWSGRTNSGSKIGKGTYLVKLTDLQSGTVAIDEKIIYQTH